MKSFKFINNIAGWLCFAIAALVYLLTIEPTTSLWDCGEFIATSYKMEIGHAPGNSMFMLIARFFTLFTSSAENVALLVNVMSALCSAFCILFLFWSITHLARRIYAKNNDALGLNETIAIIGAGFVGALAYTFSDTLWFSAVEGEVYSMSSLFTALVFWAILKWEEEVDEKFANRWLILLAYLMGISIGIHLLNLLALPAIVFVYYFKKYTVTKKGMLVTLLLSAVILITAVFVIIPGLPQIAKIFELLFVNNLGLPYNSGLAFFSFFTFAILSLAVYYTYQPKKNVAYIVIALFALLVCVLFYGLLQSLIPIVATLLFILVCGLIMRFASKYRVLLNTILLCTTVFLLGYFSLTTIVIRSVANPPVNENAPDNVFSLISYIGREQYGANPLFIGPSFASPMARLKNNMPITEENTTYFKDTGKDGKDHYGSEKIFAGYKYNPDYNMLFPRLYSRSPSHIEEYAQWTGMKLPRDENRRYAPNVAWKGPKMIDNINYMVKYQFNWMYWRYFMWNYVGRQNDFQGHGSSFEGNWITGLTAFDDWRLGIDSNNMPDYLKENKGYNKYFLLPFILGLIGLFFQLMRDKRNFTVVFLLFIMTGLAIAFYLNMPPRQPRERDYVFAGSTYAFAIWIGIGVLAVYNYFKRFLKKSFIAPVAASAICMIVPGIMGVQNWDDHDRSNRYTARDAAYNYLSTCGKNAILVTFGDNDTFPLWYLQEVEEERTDVRIMNTSLLRADWYINQMKCKVYDSDPIVFSLGEEHYRAGTNEGVFIESIREMLTPKQIINFITDPKVKEQTQGESLMPTRIIAVPVDKEAALKNGIVAAKDSHHMLDTIYLQINGGKQYLMKSEMMFIDLLANYKWDRPIYFTSSYGDIELGQNNYLQLEGFAYKFVPIYTRDNGSGLEAGRIDTDILYKNLMTDYRWGNMNVPGVLIDYHNIVTFSVSQNVRGQFARLAKQLIAEGKTDKAVEVLDRCMELMPRNPFYYNMSIPQQEFAAMDMIESYYKLNETEKGNKLFDEFFDETSKCLKFFTTLKSGGYRELELNLMYLQQIAKVALEYGDKERAGKVTNLIEVYISQYQSR